MPRGGWRQRFSLEQKRQIVEATLVHGASVALVARERGVNANQVFAWRKSYQLGLLEDRGAGGVKLLPVHVAGFRNFEQRRRAGRFEILENLRSPASIFFCLL